MIQNDNVRFKLNGETIETRADRNMSLLQFLRWDKALTGAKEGCGKSQCGTCTVLLNGRPTKSCGIKLSSGKLPGAEVITIEGLASVEQPIHPIQRAFVDAGAVQCGFCTPGMVLTAKGLLDQTPFPTREEIRDYFGKNGNICRCTGYQRIFEAVTEAAAILNNGKRRFEHLPDDASLSRTDATLKATGQTRYADDIVRENMLYGRVIFADSPHGRLENLDMSFAKEVPGYIGHITAEDIPGSRKTGMINRDQPALVAIGEECRSLADPVAAVFADSPAAANALFEAVSTSWKELPGVYTVEEAKAPNAPLVHDDKPGNLFFENSLKRGDADSEISQATVTIRNRFSTSRVIHGFMEPEAGWAELGGDGGVIIHYPTQTVFDDQAQVAEVLDLPKHKVRIIQLPTGGAFGGKEDVIFHHILGLAALKFKRPVRITLSRDQSLMVCQKRHPTWFDCSLSADSEGRFTALKARVEADKGAYAALGYDIMENIMSFIGGSYFIPAVDVSVRSYYTHNVMSGAMRGFGANQANFFIESLVNMVANKLGMDPFDIRLKNALKPGLPTITDHVLEPGVPGVTEVIEALREAVQQEEAPTTSSGRQPGFGIACGLKNLGFGHGLPESAGARVELSTDGRINLSVTHHEYGQGAMMGQARIASEILGVPIDQIQVSMPDTGCTPYTGATTASRQTFISGKATMEACERLKSDLFELAAEKLEVLDPAQMAIDKDRIRDRNSGQSIALSELGETFSSEQRTFPPETAPFRDNHEVSDYGSPEFKSRRTHWAYAYGAQAAWLELDEKSGETRVLKIISVNDVGRILNRRAVEAQMEGGAVMGLGYALSEEFRLENGRPLTKGLRQCGLPKATDAPEIICRPVEVPHPWGPLGVKGLAEAPSLATAPAIANALADAASIRLFDLPMTPERVKASLQANKK
ncbi:MAG: molybdopterin-dependent oxidoreductase [Deltaproteobacteria bacterium]|nr:molybdopterin-dependent oxidoreductase [Deltaproteobacteria bacterium]